MENQHRKISGYRELSEQEIALMNKIKALGPKIEEVLLEVKNHLASQDQVSEEELQRLRDATPYRFVALAKTDFQVGLMKLTRAVAQPTFF